MKRILSEAQKLAARNATRRYRAKQCGEPLEFVASKRSANSGSFTSERLRKNGMHDTKTWRAWKDMEARCTNPGLANYSRYGGRGITVCERWQVFDNFYADMGECPPGLSIERKNNEGNYEPGNCKWADRIEQAKNTRRNKKKAQVA